MKFRGAGHEETIRDFCNDVKVFFSFRAIYYQFYKLPEILSAQKSANLPKSSVCSTKGYFLKYRPVSGTKAAARKERDAETRGRDRAAL